MPVPAVVFVGGVGYVLVALCTSRRRNSFCSSGLDQSSTLEDYP
jgi:hypothetical protein